MTFKLGSFCFHLLNAYIMGMGHHTWFLQHRGFNPGICACWTSTLPAKLHPQYLKLFLKSFILNLDFNVCFNSLKSVHSWITKYMSGIYVFLYKTLFWKCKKKKKKIFNKNKRMGEGCWDSWAGESACHQAWLPTWDQSPQHLHGRKIELTLIRCPWLQFGTVACLPHITK